MPLLKYESFVKFPLFWSDTGCVNICVFCYSFVSHLKYVILFVVAN